MKIPDCLNRRVPETHKGDYGHALLIAGSYGKMGAAVLAAEACLCSGTGLLTAHVARRGVDILQIAVPEAMLSIDDHDTCFATLPHHLERYNAVAVGPGIGTAAETQTALLRLLPLLPANTILDADALNIVALNKAQHLLPQGCIITPHAKEYERLFGGADPAAMARRHHIYIVKKSHRTHIYAPDGTVAENDTGNAGMATAGSGDVLTGILLALAAQGNTPMTTAVTGVWLHGKSGDIAVQKQSQASLIARDIIKNLGKAAL